MNDLPAPRNKARSLTGFLLLFFLANGLVAQTFPALSDRRELFIDEYLLDKKDNIRLVLHSPKNQGRVLAFDRPWEGAFSAYGTVIKDGPLFRLYYRGVPRAGKDGNSGEVTCYAESMDGIQWSKPDLGIHQVDGTMANNVVLAAAAPATHNFSPFLDTNPSCPKDERYKAFGGVESSGLIAFVSPDGIHWNKKKEGILKGKGMFDSQNVAFWSEAEQQYVCYFRTWSDGGYNGFRSVSRSTSKDFLHWSEPEKMTFGNTPLEHLYTQQTSPYYRAPHLYVAIGARFMPNRKVLTDEQAKVLNVDPNYYKDCSDAIFMTSRGKNVYDRIFMESFIRPGVGLENWVSRSNYPVLNVVETSPEEMSVYVNEDYAQSTAHVKRYALRIDGFSSLQADYQGGEVLTKPFTFRGEKLEINYSTSAAGSIKIEIQDADGQPIRGFTESDASEIIGNEIKRQVSWGAAADLSQLSGKPVRLRIVMKDANLYSFRFY
jgi:hypothetical protein